MFTFFTLALVMVAEISGAPDNRGTEFIIGYMSNGVQNRPVELYVTTSKTTTVYVHVTAPRYPTVNLNENFEITAGQVKQLKIDNRIRGMGTALETKGILVTGNFVVTCHWTRLKGSSNGRHIAKNGFESIAKGLVIFKLASDEVVVYGINIEGHSNDAFLGFPMDVLGKEYYSVTHHPSDPMSCQFLIVGVEDVTNINIQYPSHSDVSVVYAGTTYGPSSTQTITMNRYDTYQAKTMGDLTGTFISGDKKFAVFSGNQLTNINPISSSGGTTLDAIVDQMLPVETWGKDFAIVPTPFRTVGDQVRFIGAEDSTNVIVDCSGSYYQTFTVDAGKYVQKITPSDQVCHVTSSKAIMVILFVISQLSLDEPADPSIITIPPMEQYAADYTFATPQYSGVGSYANYFLFIVSESERSGLKLDGNAFPTGTLCTTIPNTLYCGGFIQVSDGTHAVRHDSPISLFGGFMYGAAYKESYGMPMGMRLAPINLPCITSTSTTGDGIDNDCDGFIDEEICTATTPVDDDGDGLIDEDCSKPTPIHGNWGTWGAWIDTMCYCIADSTSGNKPRRRTCDNPAPQYDGDQCVGDDTSYQHCTPTGDAACPLDGGYSVWSPWNPCPVTCGEGTTQRTRTCTNPAPVNGGQDCTLLGVDTNSQTCHSGTVCQEIIQRDGAWGAWESWTECTVTCDTGITTRLRHCDNPVPLNGLDCEGAANEYGECNKQQCGSTDQLVDTLCPDETFACMDNITCINSTLLCDCTANCPDGSDETLTWGLCTHQATCGSGAQALFTLMSVLLAVVIQLLAVVLFKNVQFQP